MNILLLAGYRPIAPDESPLGLNADFPLLENQIRQFRNLGLRVTVVLSGPSADQQLRECRALQNCEIVFDTNGAEVNLMSNTRAGLASLDSCALVHPVEVPCPESSMINQLARACQYSDIASSSHIVQVKFDDVSPFQFGFPLGVTALGHELILAEKTIRKFTDPRLHFKPLIHRGH